MGRKESRFNLKRTILIKDLAVELTIHQSAPPGTGELAVLASGRTEPADGLSVESQDLYSLIAVFEDVETIVPNGHVVRIPE